MPGGGFLGRPPVAAGDVVEVFWEGEREWYKGVVMGMARGGKAGTVQYDDGDVEEVGFDISR